MADIEKKMDEALLDALEGMNKLPAGSKEKLTAAITVEKLYKARDQRYKSDMEYNSAMDCKEMELKAKTAELETMKSENRKNRTVQVATTVGTLAFWGYQFAKTLQFEETGTATSSVFKTLNRVIKF